MEQEKLSLKWNDFQENLTSTFRMLGEDREFADVTLVCEDGQQVEAHKVILASSSPFFLNLLRRNKHPHPLIYMRGLKSEDLVAMIDFLYFGEANVYQENLDSFLAVAEELQLKGLRRSGAEKEDEDIQPEKERYMDKTPEKPSSFTKSIPNNLSQQGSSEERVKYEPPLAETVAVPYNGVAVDLQDLDDTIKSMMIFSENMTSKNGRARICKVCGKEGQYTTIMSHIESNHITGVSHTCNICGNSAKTRNSLGVHKSKHHSTKIINYNNENLF